MKRLPLLLLVLSTISGTAGTATVALRVGSPPQGPNAEDVAREMPSHVRVEHVATRSEAINGALPLERSYSARDGFGFSYPAGWFVEAHEVGTVSFLTNFRLGVTCCHMVDGQIKVDFWSLPTSEAREMDLTYDERCAGVGEDRVISCSQHRTPSAVWGWVHVASHDGEALYAIAEKGGRTYIAVGLVPSGPRSDAGLDRVRDVFRTFRIA